MIRSHLGIAMRVFPAILTGFGTLILAGCAALDATRYEAPFHYSYEVSPGARVSLHNSNGEVKIAGWAENRVEISGAKFASSRALLDQVRVEIRHDANSIEIRTIRPSDLLSGSGARYSIQVPRGAALDPISSTNGAIRVEGVENGARLTSSNGGIHAGDLKGNVDAHTTNGAVTLDGLRGECDARTTNGSIHVSFAEGPRGDIHAQTTNGSITLTLPPGAGGKLEANTSHGAISTELDVNGGVHADRNHLDGTIGSGGPLIELKTTNGRIRLLRRDRPHT